MSLVSKDRSYRCKLATPLASLCGLENSVITHVRAHVHAPLHHGAAARGAQASVFVQSFPSADVINTFHQLGISIRQIGTPSLKRAHWSFAVPGAGWFPKGCGHGGSTGASQLRPSVQQVWGDSLMGGRGHIELI